MEQGNNVDTGSISTIGGQIANILSTIGIIVAVIVLLVLGIKYMMGSASEKQNTKNNDSISCWYSFTFRSIRNCKSNSFI